MPVETRFMRSDRHTINGLEGYKLGTEQTTTYTYGSRNLLYLTSTYVYPSSDVLTEWNVNPSGSHYSAVDDYYYEPDDTDYVYTNENRKAERYGISGFSLPSGYKIGYVQVVVRHRGGTKRVGLYINGQPYYGTVSSSSDWITRVAKSWDKNPATGQLWTEDDINNAQFYIYNAAAEGVDTYVSQIYLRVYYYLDRYVYFGLRVWKRASDGTETEVTSGVSVLLSMLLSTYHSDGAGIRSGTWDCPQTSLASTDSIVVGIYVRLGSTGSWYLQSSYRFTTEQLGASQLDMATWTVYLYLRPFVTSSFYSYFYFGTSTYNSRIEGFSWSVAPPPVARRFYGDGLTLIAT